MKNFNLYITEKLKINKNTRLNFSKEEIDAIISSINKFFYQNFNLHYKWEYFIEINDEIKHFYITIKFDKSLEGDGLKECINCGYDLCERIKKDTKIELLPFTNYSDDILTLRKEN